ncbi:aminoacyl-tRNA hydrolase [bacterium]|jgi:PTH1 family peptidyl-tRNA hydrolase|nr:aminoacyl-tRNA hydrolase [bacterium]
MKLVVGLGNPGPQYESTRHNIGFLCADYLIEEWRAQGPVIKNKAGVYQAQVDGEQVLLIKPQTFMNLSGRSVAPFYTFYKCAPSDLIVLHDELDIEPLEIRFKTGGSAGGHNGLKSIDECLGAGQQGYHRVRLGIGHPRTFEPRMDVADYVLGRIPDGQWDGLEGLFEKAEKGIRLVFQGKIGEAMNKFHGRPKASRDK